jgi:two-component system chemotaxis response regulator CheB
MNTKNAPIRVLIAEDSPVARELLVAILQNAPGVQVVGTARNGAEAVRLTQRLKPDVITMDVHMPEMDGIAATRQIMAEMPRPIVMLSASLNKNKHNLTFDALQAGALSVLEKPALHDPPETHADLIHQIKLMAEVKVVRRWGSEEARRRGREEEQGTAERKAPGGGAGEQRRVKNQPANLRAEGPLWATPLLRRNGQTKIQLVAMASSTGGPGVLAKILSQLPANFPVPILVVQHITSGFGAGLATWLDQQTPLEVRLARQGDEPQAGQVLLAPDDYHMQVNRLGLITLNQTPREQGVRPSANVLFHSLAQVYRATALGIILTGMGSDGALGLRAMREVGAFTIAQDKESCVVFGMPAVAIELGAVEQVLPASQVAAAVKILVQPWNVGNLFLQE